MESQTTDLSGPVGPRPFGEDDFHRLIGRVPSEDGSGEPVGHIELADIDGRRRSATTSRVLVGPEAGRDGPQALRSRSAFSRLARILSSVDSNPAISSAFMSP